MSNVIDTRVVEMDFDNANFEKNAATSIGTLAKLKESLKLDDAAKSLGNIDKSVSGVDFSSMAQGIDSLKKRFSTLGIIGMQVIQNLTNSAMRFVNNTMSTAWNSIVTGGINRATNLENAHFQLQGLLNDEEKVQAVMANVNEAVDGTAYSLDAAATVASQLAASGMTAGDDMLNTLKGIAGVAAMTNSSYEDIGRIYTTVAGNGRLMGDQLLQLSGRGINAAATIGKVINKTEAEVREMVSSGEIDFQTFSNAMNEAFGEHATKANETFNGAMSNIKSALARIGALFVSPMIEQNGPLVQLFNTIRTKINDIKTAITPLSEVVTDFANNVISKLNSAISGFDMGDFLGGSDSWTKIQNEIENTGISFDTFEEKLKEVANSQGIAIDDIISQEGSLANAFRNGSLSGSLIIDTLKSFTASATESAKATTDVTDKLEEFYNKVVGQVISGDFGNGEARINALTEAGYDQAAVQALVNKVWERNGKTFSDTSVSAEELAEVIGDMSEEELTSVGVTQEQADALKNLAKQAEETGTPINELIDKLNKPNKKTLTIGTLQNALSGIVGLVEAIGIGFSSVFSGGGSGNVIYAVINAVHSLSEHLALTDEDVEKLGRTFSGLFSVLKLITTIVGGAFRIAWEAITKALSAFNLDILDVTASIGDVLTSFKDFVLQNELINKTFDKLTSGIAKLLTKLPILVDKFQDWIDVFKRNTTVEKFIDAIKSLRDSISDLLDGKISIGDFASGLGASIASAFKSLPGMAIQFGKDVIAGFQNGLSSSFFGNVISTITDFATEFLSGFAETLGVHSPSTIAFEYGMNVVQGFLNGVVETVSSVLPALKDAAVSLLQGFLKFLPSETVYAAGEETAESFGEGINMTFGDVAKIIKEFCEKAVKVIKEFDWNKAVSFIPLIAILLIVRKVYNIAKMLGKGTDAVINVLTGFNEGVTGVLSSVKNNIDKVGSSISKTIESFAFSNKTKSLRNIAVSIAILTASLVALAYVASKDDIALAKGIGALLAISVILGILAIAVDKLSGTSVKMKDGKASIEGFKTTIIQLGAALLLAAIAVKTLDGIQDPKKAFGGLAGIAAGIIVFMIAMNKIGKSGNLADIAKIGTMMLALSVAMLIIAKVIKIAGTFSLPEILQGTIFMISFAVFVGLLTNLSAIGADKKIGKLGASLLAITVSMLLMIAICKMVNKLSADEINSGILWLGIFGVFIYALVKVATISKDNQLAKLGGALLGISISMLLFIVIAKLASKMNAASLIAGVGFMALFILFIYALVKIAQIDDGKKMARLGTTLIAMAFAVTLLAAVATLMGLLPLKVIAKGVAAIFVLMTGMAIMIAALKGAQNVTKSIVAMTVAVAVIAALVYLLAAIPFDDLAPAAIGMAVLMALFALMLYAAQFAKGSISAVAIMIIVVGLLGGLLYLLSEFTDVDKLTDVAIALSALMLAFSVSLLIISGINGISKSAIASIAVMVLVVAALAGVLYALQGLMLNQAIVSVGAITVLIGVLIGALALLNIIKSPAAGSLAALAVVTLVVVALAVIIYKLQGLTVSNAVAILIAVGGLVAIALVVCAACTILSPFAAEALIGLAVLAIVIVAIAGITYLVAEIAFSLIAQLPQVGSDLSAFMDNAQPFLSGISNVPDGIAGKAAALAAAVVLLAGADFIAQILTAVGPLSELGTELGLFMAGATPFIIGANSIPDDISGKVGKLSAAILKLTGTDLINSIKEFLTGGSTLSDLGTELQTFGEGMSAFTINSSNIDNAIESMKKFDQVEDATEDVDLSNLDTIGTDLATYATTVSEIDTGSISTSINAIKRLSAMLTELSGQDFGTIENFKITSIGKELAKYTNKISDADFSMVGDSITAASRIRSFVSTLSGFNSEGASSFKITELAKSISKYANTVSSLDTGAISSSITAATKVKNFIQGLTGFSGSGVSSFQSAINQLASTDMSSLTSTFSSAATSMSTAGTSMMSSLSSSISTGSSQVSSAATSAATGALTAVSGMTSRFTSVGTSLMSNLARGMSSARGSVVSAGASCASGAYSAAAGYSGSFYSIGYNLGAGLARGLWAAYPSVVSAANAIVAQANRAAAAKAQVKSPSRVWMRIGGYMGEGLAIGIGKQAGNVAGASEDIADAANNSLANALSNVYDFISGNIDAEPTITPVVDLTNVTASANTIGGMFNNIDLTPALATVGSINYGMNKRNQNAGNSDVVSAIDKLAKHIDNMERSTTNINGITYDDGSNVANAVSSLVRAAKIERRI